jgi:hypothetical protein
MASLKSIAFTVAIVAPALVALRAADPPKAAAWDAKYVRMDVPTTVTANQVFAVKITMKNTGTETWKEARDIIPSSLRSQSPDDNDTWGTNYIIQGQGTVIAPGQEFTYKSHLRAPGQPGKYVFQWRLHGKPGLFGEQTEKVEITVVQGEEPKTQPPAVPAPDKDGKRALTPDDFEYLGSFKLPESAGKGRAGYSESGLAVRKLADGSRQLFLNYTHPEGTLFEADIPELARFAKGDASALKTATVKKVWGSLVTKDSAANGGLWWDEDKKLLYWTYYHGYWTGGDLRVLNATKLDADKMTRAGAWTVPQQKWHWGGVTRLPKSFADKYTDGKTLALGFGGYYSIVATCSRGPSLSALAEPDPEKGRVEGVVNLLGYTGGAAAPRTGDYFSANCDFWYESAKSRNRGTWTFCDHTRCGVLIDLADKQGYVAFVKLGTGRLGYDYGKITNAGESQFWYFYDTRQLGEVAKGSRKSGALEPYVIHPDAGMGGQVTGAYFDEEQRRLYVFRMHCYAAGREMHPLVHVYQIKK